jgi:hypothetical protein
VQSYRVLTVKGSPRNTPRMEVVWSGRRLGIETDPRYVNRYHGPDGIGINTRQHSRMAETEIKASQGERVRVVKDMNKNR